MKFATIASLAFIGGVAAQNSTTAATGCVAKDNACRTSDPVTGLSANQAQCSSENAQCQGDCYAAYNTCRTTRGPDSLSANRAQCVSDYAACIGENPIASSGGLTVLPYNVTTSSSAAGSMVYTTQVVTALTTVCPGPTAGAYTTTINNNVYTVSTATTITVTDCPCTISTMVPTTTPVGGIATGVKTDSTATTPMLTVYTGAAAAQHAGMGFLGVAAGAVMLL